jgi:adenosine deaminase
MIAPDLPLVDLHRHLEGSIRVATILDLGRQHNVSLPATTLDALRPFIVATTPKPDVMTFLMPCIQWMVGVLGDIAACHRITYEAVEDAHCEGLDYLELRFSPYFMAQPHHLNVDAVVEAVVAGAQQASRDFGLKVNLIGIISRTYGAQVGWQELNALLTKRDAIVALDLAGDEINFPAEMFVDHFKKARDVGWQVTIHAGEGVNTLNVWQAIKLLGATRIGHGVNVIEDPALMDYLRQHHIGLEISLTSNLQTSVVPNYAAHPLRHFVEQGLLVSINADDPVMHGIDLRYEYEIAAPAAGLSAADLRRVQENALLMSYLSKADQQALRDRALHR